MDFDSIATQGITGAISGGLGWWFGRRKENVDIKSSELDNTSKAVEIWQNLAEKLSAKVDELSEKVDKLTIENQQLRGTILDLESRIGITQSKPKKTTK